MKKLNMNNTMRNFIDKVKEMKPSSKIHEASWKTC